MGHVAGFAGHAAKHKARRSRSKEYPQDLDRLAGGCTLYAICLHAQ